MGNETKPKGRKKKPNESVRKHRAFRTSDLLALISSLSNEALWETEEAIVARQELTQRFLKEIEKEIAEAMKMLRLLGQPWQADKKQYSGKNGTH